jgi:ParB family protein of integrating conjugative element (PFGI_1 class)
MAMTESLPATERPATQASGETSGYVALEIEIAQIQTYERNPRHGRNPEYDRIKDSIRIHGLDQPLLITQRPGATDYIVHAGGNTRLLILKELFAETSDVRFSRVPCLYKEWTCESDVLLAHLRENDLRGSLTFIDKAQAVFEAKQLLEAELNIDEISFRQLEKELRATGYSVSSGLISQMGYAGMPLS